MNETRRNGLIWFAEGWSITDPDSDELAEAQHRLRYPPAHYDPGQQRSDTYRVLRAAEDYQFLASYALGVEHCIKKLRAVWRARRPQ